MTGKAGGCTDADPPDWASLMKDLKGRTFAFGDKGSTSGYLIPSPTS
jgi:ABC-type phosphate/phosphonate transport system substrate-binding protein